MLYRESTREDFPADEKKAITNYIEQFLTERYNLDKSGGEKPVMNVDDLYRAQYTHWVSDQAIFADERQRIQLALLILIQAYTATRPRVLTYRKPNKIAIEDYHYRWDGKKTMWDMDDDEPAKPEDNELMKSEDDESMDPDGDESGESDDEGHIENKFKTLCYKDIKLYLIKGGDGERDRKTFTISEVDNLLFDATIPFLALAFLDNAFESDILNTPIFRQPMKQEDGICRTSKTEALYYDTYRRDLRRLSMIAGFRQVLKPYAIRRGGGEAIEKVGTQGQLQQVMSHASDLTYQAYINPRVQVDTVAAFLKRPPNQRLLEMATHMSRDTDPSAPTGATSADIETKGVIIALTKNRDSLKKAIRSKYGTIGKAKEVNPELWTQYNTTKRKLINYRKRLLERKVMKQRKAYFKESSTKEINRQLQKKENPAIESGTPSVPPKPSYTLPKRKTLAEFIYADASTVGAHNSDKQDFVNELKNWWEPSKVPLSFSEAAANFRSQFKSLLEKVASRKVILEEKPQEQQTSRDASNIDLQIRETSTEDTSNIRIPSQDTLIQQTTNTDLPARETSTRGTSDTHIPTQETLAQYTSDTEISAQGSPGVSNHAAIRRQTGPASDTQDKQERTIDVDRVRGELEGNKRHVLRRNVSANLQAALLAASCDLSSEEAIIALLGNKKGAKLLRLDEETAYVCFKCSSVIATRLESKRMAEDDLLNSLASSINPTEMEFS
ncbi:hypothetical protein PT974_02904 [Cladobotryum mycophilum]|uniref:Uncharacterized protein n=1 Tax=Cladobotryum mycophilum TaxID=491253 RepID=A0ABR0SZB5_9HYPO